MTTRAVEPGTLSSTGTSRQPSRWVPSSAQASAISDSQTRRSGAAGGRKATPTPYAPASGSVSRVLSARNSWGTWRRIPAPSPLSGSAPVAPRWPRLTRARIGELDDVVIALAGGRGHERDPASVVLEPRIAKIAAGRWRIGHPFDAMAA